MMQAYLRLKEETIDLTTSHPTPTHDHGTLYVHKKITQKERYI